MNGKFQEKYGLLWKDMDQDTRLMALMSEIFDLREQEDKDKQELKEQITDNKRTVLNAFKIYSEACDVVKQHQTYWKFALWIGATLALTLLGVVTEVLVRTF